MLITLDLESDIPIYQQLRDEIVRGLAAKKLAPEEGLPPVRALAQDLGINMHTVNKAYNILRAEGFIGVHKRRGVFVRRPEEYRAEAAHLDELKERLRPILAELLCRGLSAEEILPLCRVVIEEF